MEPWKPPAPFQHFDPQYSDPLHWFPWLEGRGDVFTASRKFSALPREALKQLVQFWRSHFGLLQPRQPKPAGLLESCQLLEGGNTSWQTGHLLWTILISRELYQSKSPAESSCQLERDALWARSCRRFALEEIQGKAAQFQLRQWAISVKIAEILPRKLLFTNLTWIPFLHSLREFYKFWVVSQDFLVSAKNIFPC